MGANYSFEVKNIEIWAPAFFKHNNSFIATVFSHFDFSFYVQDMHLPIVTKENKEDRIKILVDYFSSNRNNHTFYAIKFFGCEVLNFVNVLGQIYFMDFFLGGT